MLLALQLSIVVNHCHARDGEWLVLHLPLHLLVHNRTSTERQRPRQGARSTARGCPLLAVKEKTKYTAADY